MGAAAESARQMPRGEVLEEGREGRDLRGAPRREGLPALRQRGPEGLVDLDTIKQGEGRIPSHRAFSGPLRQVGPCLIPLRSTERLQDYAHRKARSGVGSTLDQHRDEGKVGLRQNDAVLDNKARQLS
eukprot:scaffold7055_cov254-Pinguiococcus_pyrenoidosus.AAC.13